MIPKKLHFAWFGGGEKSPLVRHCIESFNRHCPSFEVCEWNEENFDISQYSFASHAASHKKWAFVSDVCRAHVLNHVGGYFLDADNEITNEIDAFLDHRFVTGFENYRGNILPVTAFMGSEPNSRVSNFLCSYYRFLKDFSFVPNTIFISEYFVRELGVVPDNTLQVVDDLFLAPSSYFCSPEPNRSSYAIHHFSGSWKK